MDPAWKMSSGKEMDAFHRVFVRYATLSSLIEMYIYIYKKAIL